MNQNSRKGEQAVATRRFRSASGSDVVATVYQPELLESDQWKSAFTVDGLSEEIAAQAYGVDALQALEMALQGVRVHLVRSGEELTWLDGEPGYLGIARIIPDSYGAKVENHLAKVVDDELARLLEEDVKTKGRPGRPGQSE